MGDILPITLPHRTAIARLKSIGPLFDLLNFHSPQTFKHEDHFLGDIAIATREPGYTTSSNGTSAAVPVLTSAGAGGTVEFVTGTDDNGYSGLFSGAANWTADNNPRMAARVKLSAITGVKIEVGFTDATGDAGAINALDTPTATADDCACAIFDTDATEDNWQFAGARATTAWSIATVDQAPVADTYQWITVALDRINLDTDNVRARMYIGNKLVAEKSIGAIANTTALFPYVFVQCRAGSASRTGTLDYFAAWGDCQIGGMSI
jgi:hypothetical protein